MLYKASNTGSCLNFSMLWANSADDKLIIFLFFLENSVLLIRQIFSFGDNLHELSNTFFPVKKRKFISESSCLKLALSMLKVTVTVRNFQIQSALTM